MASQSTGFFEKKLKHRSREVGFCSEVFCILFFFPGVMNFRFTILLSYVLYLRSENYLKRFN